MLMTLEITYFWFCWRNLDEFPKKWDLDDFDRDFERVIIDERVSRNDGVALNLYQSRS